MKIPLIGDQPVASVPDVLQARADHDPATGGLRFLRFADGPDPTALKFSDF